jgi:hypothetical protein
MDYFSLNVRLLLWKAVELLFFKDRQNLGFISSNISVSAENLIETTQKINYTPFLR